MRQRYMVLYRAAASEKDRARVRKKLHASLSSKFANPLLEELQVEVKNTDKGKAEMAKRLECAKKDSAVQSVQPSYSYKLL
jgi:hypothetical protein